MPIRLMVDRFGVFLPTDLDFLQSVYDEAVQDLVSVDDATMAELARLLLNAYSSGTIDRERLLTVAKRAYSRQIA